MLEAGSSIRIPDTSLLAAVTRSRPWAHGKTGAVFSTSDPERQLPSRDWSAQLPHSPGASPLPRC
jgi:hypothetical protein